ncbi:hypothetical protein GJ744_003529 [Endocarpon pusillum]|uniref:Uncharacterized protein n=1 Tax=Endocarpon pusillum TaxID=364733 RepID=A0A8H7E861_9EURO|nr:hypothetical protein GJ744_003529 [Endocarpon pusillum]
MIVDNLPYMAAFLLTASIHMAWPLIPYAIHQQFCLLVSNRSSMGLDFIKLHTFALILLLSSLSFRTTSAAASTAPLPSYQFNQTYNFDDLPTTHGLGPIASYNFLTFTGFSVLAPQDPNLPYILPSDRNCATSLPNALLGSRYSPQLLRPTMAINATAATRKGFHAYFDLLSVYIKPIAMPVDPVPVMANVTIRGWSAASDDDDDAEGEAKGDPLVFWVEWTSGYTEPLLVEFSRKQGTKDKWRGLELLDFTVDFGPDQLDWEFCLDDLTVGFMRCGGEMCEGSGESEKGRRAEGIERENYDL